MKKESAILRTVTRKNNKIRKDYPLFYDLFKTDYDTEKKKKEDNQIDSAVHFEWMEEHDKLDWFEIEYYKRILMHLGRQDIIEYQYTMYDKFYYGQPYFLCDALHVAIAKILGFQPPIKCNDQELKKLFPFINKPF